MSTDPSRNAPLRRLALLGAAFVLAIVSCGKDLTGPAGSAVRYARGLAFDAIFPPAFQAAGGTSSGVVSFNRVHVVLHHPDGSIALDTLIDFPADSSSFTIGLTVKLLDDAPASGEPMSLNLGYLDASGDTVFKGGPVAVTAAPPPPGGGSNPPVQVPVSYVGPGSNAVSVAISPRTATVAAGAPFSFSAVATDAGGNILSATPIIWNSLDPALATISSAAAGAGVAGSVRGTARIEAQLLTGATDQVLLTITLPAATITAQSGNAQSGVVGANLAQPLVVKVAASDGVPVAGTTVTFAVAAGGGSVASSSVVSDANGLAQTTWKLGTSTGTQTVTASSGSLTNSPLAFTASAQAATATQLVVTTQPTSGIAGATLTAVVVTAEDNNGNIAAGFTGAVSLAFGSSAPGATLSGAATVNAVAGVATFASLAVNKNGTGYTLVAASSGLNGATTSAFDIALGAPKQLVFTVQPAGGTANATIAPAIVVNAEDSQGNPTPSFTGAVTVALASNPGGATLGGATTANAVNGAATFSNLTVSLGGAGYALGASATGLSGATSASFNIGGGVAASIAVASGGSQTGAPSAALAQPVVVKVSDSGGNGVAGTLVSFAVVTGGGSVSPTSGVSNASGQVQTTWTLGAPLGAQSISASSVGLAGSPLTINATAASAVLSQLVITTQPSNATAGAPISPAIVVTAKDASNNVVTTFTGNVSLAFGANPGGATLGGTVTVAAVAGVATFGTISLNKSGVGYTLVASAGTFLATTNTFNITAGAASTLGITAGQAQSGAPGSPLVTPLGVTILDAFGNAVAGVTVNWATPSGGSFSPASSATNAAGIATSTWTLGATPGPQTASATSGTLTGSPAGFTATAALASFSKTWTGTTSTAWTTPTNWAPNGVPVAGDSVDVPAGGNQPAINGATTVKHLTLGAGAILTLTSSPTVTVTGNLSVGGAIAGTGFVALTGTGTVGGVIAPNVSVQGAYTAAGAVTLAGTLTVTGSLDLNGQTVAVAGAFQTAGAGTLKMNSAATMTVASDVTFAGGPETGLITAGTISSAGTFTQSGGAASFVATGSNVVQLAAAVAKTLSISSPATATFQNLTVANTAGLTLQTDFTVTNVMTVAAGTATGTGTAVIGFLTDASAGLSVSTLVFTGATIATPVVSGNVTFSANPTQMLANVTVNGNARVTGNLQLNAHSLNVNGSFRTTGSGQVTMTNAADAMTVSGNMSFAGGSETGLLTNGLVTLSGNFNQLSTTSTSSYQAASPHQLQMAGSNNQTIAFQTPDTVFAGACAQSCFGDFTVNKSGGALSYLSASSVNGNLTVNGGAESVQAVGTVGNQRFLLVRGGTVTAGSVAVQFSRFGTFGTPAFDPSAEIDTIQFHGTAAQMIGGNDTTFESQVIIKGTPTIAAGGFTVDGDLTVDGGNLTLGGQQVSVEGGFTTTGTGVVTMTNPHDSLLVMGQATFAGGGETGHLTNGTLFLFDGIVVGNTSANQFNATGSHTTYLVGPNVGCECEGSVLAPGRRAGISASAVSGARKGRLTAAGLAARRAAARLAAKGARTKSAAIQAAHKALASKWTSRATAVRAAAAAGRPAGRVAARVARAPRPAQRAGASAGATVRRRPNATLGSPTARNGRRGGSSANIVVQSYSDSPIFVTFADSTGNQFANVHIVGSAEWQTFARVAGSVLLDTTADLEGNGHIAIGGTLTGSQNSNLVVESVELFGVLADTGFFGPDTTVFSGTAQTVPVYIGTVGYPFYNNVVVNGPSVNVLAEDGNELDFGGSLFILNSGQLRIGAPDSTNCLGCESDELYVSGALETHGAGTLRMNDQNDPYLTVSDSAWFAGGSSAGLLTWGEIDYYGNFRQSSSPTPDSYSATSPHESYFGASSGVQFITFATPAYASSHFGYLYLGDSATTLNSDAFADGQLGFGRVISHILQGTPGRSITSKGASARNIVFSGVSWTLLDGYPVDDMDNLEFSNQVATGTQFTVQRDSSFNTGVSLSNWIFDTTPTGGGLYISATDLDGATSGVLTLNMSSTSPSLSGGFVSTSGGAVINGWPATVVDNWLGNTSAWNSTANWSTGLVPTASTDVAIFCDCNAPQTNVATAVHNLAISSGSQLTLGTSSPLTVNGSLSVSSNSSINVGSASVTLLGDVTMDPAGSPAGIACGSGSTGAILAGVGTQNVTGKFCRLAVASSVIASGAIVVKNNTTGGAGLTVQSGGNINFNSQRVETDSMYTTGTGTITMTHAADSLVLHGANVGVPVYFNGGSTSGLITNGTIVDHSPGFQANGTAFDAAGGLNTIVADSVPFQAFKWIGASVGHGINNLIAKNTSKMFSGGDLVVTGTLTLDASMTTSGLFQATSHNLYAGFLVDNTGNTNGGFSGGGYWVHMTGSGPIPAVIGVDSLFLDYGGNMSLSSNTSTNVLIVNNSTGLYLGGHVLTTNGRDFITQNNAFLAMTNASDSLNVGTANVFFNGGGFSNTLTMGGIAAAGFYQGYTSTSALASGAAVNSYSPSGTHRLWLTGNAPAIFANPGTGSTLSHFNSLHTPIAQTVTLYSDAFIDDSLYLATATALASNQPSVLGKTRLVTAAGLADNSSLITMSNVALKFVDGHPEPTHFDDVVWSQFPTGFTGNIFEIARTTGGSATTLNSHNFSSVSFGTGGEYVNNSGTLSWSFVNSTGTASLGTFTLTAGQKNP